MNDLNASYSPNIFPGYSKRTTVKCPYIFVLNSFREAVIEFGRRSHSLGTMEERLSEP